MAAEAEGGGGAIASTTVGPTTRGNISNGPLHTKLYHDVLTNILDMLKHTLPPPPPVAEVKKKALVLDYVIMVLEGIVERAVQFEVKLAVIKINATIECILKLVKRTKTFPETAKSVIRLFIVRTNDDCGGDGGSADGKDSECCLNHNSDHIRERGRNANSQSFMPP